VMVREASCGYMLKTLHGELEAAPLHGARHSGSYARNSQLLCGAFSASSRLFEAQ